MDVLQKIKTCSCYGVRAQHSPVCSLTLDYKISGDKAEENSHSVGVSLDGMARLIGILKNQDARM
jgi:hypothetical protein